MELPTYHTCDTQSFEVASRFFKNMCILINIAHIWHHLKWCCFYRNVACVLSTVYSSCNCRTHGLLTLTEPFCTAVSVHASCIIPVGSIMVILISSYKSRTRIVVVQKFPSQNIDTFFRRILWKNMKVDNVWKIMKTPSGREVFTVVKSDLWSSVVMILCKMFLLLRVR